MVILMHKGHGLDGVVMAVEYREKTIKEFAKKCELSDKDAYRIFNVCIFLARKKVGSAVEGAKLLGMPGFVYTHIQQTRLAREYADYKPMYE
jgi:hypothetical protein